MATLIGGPPSDHALGAVAQTRVRAPHHLEIHPSQPHLFQSRANVTAEQIVPPAQGCKQFLPGFRDCVCQDHEEAVVRGIRNAAANQSTSTAAARRGTATTRAFPFFGASRSPR